MGRGESRVWSRAEALVSVIDLVFSWGASKVLITVGIRKGFDVYLMIVCLGVHFIFSQCYFYSCSAQWIVT